MNEERRELCVKGWTLEWARGSGARHRGVRVCMSVLSNTTPVALSIHSTVGREAECLHASCAFPPESLLVSRSHFLYMCPSVIVCVFTCVVVVNISRHHVLFDSPLHHLMPRKCRVRIRKTAMSAYRRHREQRFFILLSAPAISD